MSDSENIKATCYMLRRTILRHEMQLLKMQAICKHQNAKITEGYLECPDCFYKGYMEATTPDAG